MTREELLAELRELERLYVEHGKNQREENLQLKNKLRLELDDRCLQTLSAIPIEDKVAMAMAVILRTNV